VNPFRNNSLGDQIYEVGDQGDQIGRIFAYWAIVYSVKFIENYRSSPNFLGYYFHWEKVKYDENGFRYIFSQTFGHHVTHVSCFQNSPFAQGLAAF
jgi:hypothetical protein